MRTEEETIERKKLISKLIPGINLESFEKCVAEPGNTGSTGFFANFDEMSSLSCLRYRLYEFPLESLREMPDCYSFVKGTPENQVLVDLGCGRNICGYEIAKLCRFKAYIGVDKAGDRFYNLQIGKRGHKNGVYSYEERIPEEEILSVFVREGMLTFLRRLPDESVSLMANGIDENIIEGEYRKNVIKEIYRTLSPNGFYLTDSLILPHLINIKYWPHEEEFFGEGVFIKNNQKSYLEQLKGGEIKDGKRN